MFIRLTVIKYNSHWTRIVLVRSVFLTYWSNGVLRKRFKRLLLIEYSHGPESRLVYCVELVLCVHMSGCMFPHTVHLKLYASYYEHLKLYGSYYEHLKLYCSYYDDWICASDYMVPIMTSDTIICLDVV